MILIGLDAPVRLTSIPVFRSPDLSASNLAKTAHRDIYDIFALPCSSGVFVPNGRLRSLKQSYDDISLDDPRYLVMEFGMRTDLKTLHTWAFPSSGSETKICDPNLTVFVNMINGIMDTTHSMVARDGQWSAL